MTHTIYAAGRTLTEFQPLKPAEQMLLDACRKGESAWVWVSCPNEATADNVIRADFVRFLALGGDAQAPVHEHGVQLQGAWLTGVLDLESARLHGNLGLVHCHFEEAPMLQDATIRGTVIFYGCHLRGLHADRVECTGGFYLNKLIATGEVRLLGARIVSDLDCDGDFASLSVDGAVIAGNVHLNQGFRCKGLVRFTGTQIGGSLECHAAQFDGQDGEALLADNAVIKGSVFFREGFRATGVIHLVGAEIGGNLEGDGAKFDGKGCHAMMADGIVIKGSVLLRSGFCAIGEIHLLGAQIGGDLDCRGAHLSSSGGNALSADRAVVKGDISLCEAFVAEGQVRLVGAQIGGNLDCHNAVFDGQGDHALLADRATVKGNVVLGEEFVAAGEVRLAGMQVGGELDCEGATFEGGDGNALSAWGMLVEGGFCFRNLRQPVNGISLASASVGRLIDDAESWGERLTLDGFVYNSITGRAPTDAQARLVWLDKQHAAYSGKDGASDSFQPQPWRQLQKVLREMGHTEDARQVAIALENRLRHAHLIGQTPAQWNPLIAWLYRFTSRAAHCAFGGLMRYGYRPLRLVGWMLCVWLACAAFYWCAAIQGVFAPANPLVFQNPAYAACDPAPDSEEAREEKTNSAKAVPPVQGGGNWYLCEKLPEEYTGFSPLAYSLDVILPLVDLQQERDWAPMIPTPEANPARELLLNWSWKHVTRIVLWFEILFGWLASLLLVAMVSGLTKRRED